MVILNVFTLALGRGASIKLASREGARLAAGAAALQAYLNKNGASIVNSGSASGFSDPYNPTFAELKGQAYLPSYVLAATPFGGTLTFRVLKGTQNDLTGLACDTANITEGGQPSAPLASEVMLATGGVGMRTSAAAPAVLNGPGFQSIASPISGAAIVCGRAYLPNPT